MNYTNGIGPQQFPNAAEVAGPSSAGKAEKMGQAPAQVQDGSNSGMPVDEAKLSATAGAMAQAMSGSDVRTEKVAALQQSIAAGTYSVSSSDVAEKVMSALLQ